MKLLNVNTGNAFSWRQTARIMPPPKDQSFAFPFPEEHLMDKVTTHNSHEVGSLANQGINFSWTKSGLSSWGQCPTPSNIEKLTLACCEDREAKYLPTGPS